MWNDNIKSGSYDEKDLSSGPPAGCYGRHHGPALCRGRYFLASLLRGQEGAEYYDEAGAPIDDPLAFFASKGMNAMRLRLFVQPAHASAEDKGQGVCQDLDYIVPLAKRVKQAGLRLLLDFHYSDSGPTLPSNGRHGHGRASATRRWPTRWRNIRAGCCAA